MQRGIKRWIVFASVLTAYCLVRISWRECVGCVGGETSARQDSENVQVGGGAEGRKCKG